MPPKARAGRQEQTSERREQILSIAARLIAQRGYSATTVRDIADEAGILSGSLYHHFSSKEAILQEILRGFMTSLVERFEQIVAEAGTPREVLDKLIEHAFVTIERQPDAVGLYQNELSFLVKEPGFEFLQEYSARIETIWLDQIKEGQRAGDFRASLDAGITYRFIRDAVWSTVGWFRPGRGHTAASLSENYLGLLHDGLLAG
ncbi:TetR/AcrR family transcriptional regulator [Microbacterium sp. zg.Y1090]|uniref:TetR/AcrR family transcriptional regulator n=1 Tax=Microbacterium TaxID=33882 RepID=UPI00214ADA1A|nr:MULTISPECIES: TetR/AcrR family transcriptional regulator [unclassified Microbacterium]MCR2813321.1 TetR/AcrR family transcriptional regulator [Microbacterium sp. zg.Y1084]MCR2819845.1 TetR/AcrR family transcriptional regulator [Microbacterium sp. zg.Y1090]MDL5487956.1 TetR/AcrR family transcriptional regulator [Microbacterium sp. zg-Y1211]WIM28598.1 TetR/AcrR family transcriptional regulator [Microbacterium sp. zg-Y1090]